MTKSGNGTLTLSGANSYTGDTTVNAGTLNLGASNLSLATVTNAGTLNFTSTTGSASLTSLSGAGSTAFSGNATISTLNSGAVSIASGKTLTLDQGTSTGIISGAGSVSKSSANTLTLSGNNSFSGGITISGGGTVNAAHSNALGSSAVNLSAGNVYATTGTTLSNNFVIGAVGSSGINYGSKVNLLTFDFSSTSASGFGPSPTGNTSAAGSAIASYVGLTRGSGVGTSGAAAGTTWGGQNMQAATTAAAAISAGQFVTFGLTVSSSNSVKLTTDALLPYINYRSSTGADQVQWSYSINDGSYTDFGSVLTVGTSNTSVTTLTSFPTDLILNATDSITLRAAIFRNGGATPTGAGTWYFKDRTGRTDDLGIQGYVGTPFNNPATGSGTLGINSTGASTYTGTITNYNELTLTAASGGTATFSGIISGGGTINKTGAGTVNLSGVNTYSGATTVSNGILNIGSAGSIASSAVTVANAATLKATNSYTGASMPASAIAGAITLNSGALVDLTEGSLKATSLTVAALSGADVTKISYTIGKSLALTGGLTLTGNLAIDLTSELTGGDYDVVTWLGSRSGTGVFTFIDHSTASWIMTGVETEGKYTIKVAAPFTEGGNASSGTITIPNGGSLGNISGTATVTSTAPASVTGTISGGNVTLSGSGSAVNSVTAGNVTLSGGSSSVTEVKGTATVEISGTGNTVAEVKGGTLDIKGETVVTTISSGTVNVNSNATVTNLNGGNLTLAADKILTVETGSSAGTLAGSGTLAKTGNGILELSGNNSDFSGSINANAGTVKVTTAAALGSASVTLGTAAGAGESSAKLEFASTSTAPMSVSANIEATNTTSANIVENSGTGTLTLSGSLTKNGTVLTLAGGSSGINVTGNIVGSAANSDLVVSSGTVTVSSSNSYNGPTFIENTATLIADNASATGAGIVNVANGATLQVGTATNYALTLSTGGFALTNGSTIRVFVGSVDITGLTVNSGSNIDTRYTHYDLTNSAGVTYSTLLTSGALDLTGVTAGGITIEVVSANANTAGLLFDPFYDFKFLQAASVTGLGTGLNISDLFLIDTTSLKYATGTNSVAAQYNGQDLSALIKVYTVTNGGNTVLMMSIPEPSTYGLGLGALALAAVAIRRRKQKKSVA